MWEVKRWNHPEQMPARTWWNTEPNDQFATYQGGITTTKEKRGVLGSGKKCTQNISRNCFPLWKCKDLWGTHKDYIYKPFRNVKYKPNNWCFSTCFFVCLFSNTALCMSKDKPLPCVHIMTGNKKAQDYYLVMNFKEVQELLLKFPSSMSSRTVETCFLAQSQPSDFRNWRQVKPEDLTPTSVWI